MTSESPTHPDAPRAGGETPTIDLIATRAAVHTDFGLIAEARLSAKQRDALNRLLSVALRAALLERHRDAECPIGVYLVEYKDGSSVLVKAGQPWPDRWPIP